MVSPDATAPKLRVIFYSADDCTNVTIAEPAELDQFAGRDGVLWLDVQGLGDADLLRRIAARFNIHALALEDVVNAPQRPKTERYEDHQLYISRMVRDTQVMARSLDMEQVSIFIGRDYVLTFQERHGDVLDPDAHPGVHLSLSEDRPTGFCDAGSRVRARCRVRRAEVAEALRLVLPR
jgi:magnesium transporter